MPLIVELSRVVGEPHGGWVHWGATTQNITQTGDVLILRKVHRVIFSRRRRAFEQRNWAQVQGTGKQSTQVNKARSRFDAK